MKVKVLKKFRDKNTQKIYQVGEVINISKDRYNEILKVGKFVEEVQEEVQVETQEEVQEEVQVETQEEVQEEVQVETQEEVQEEVQKVSKTKKASNSKKGE